MIKTGLAALAVMLACSTALAFEFDTTPSRPRPQADRPGGGASDWVGFAATPQGRVFRTDGTFRSEEQARQNAREMCEHATARTCSSTISVPAAYDVVAYKCSQRGTSAVFFGASQLGQEDDSVAGKARNSGYDPSNCRNVARY